MNFLNLLLKELDKPVPLKGPIPEDVSVDVVAGLLRAELLLTLYSVSGPLEGGPDANLNPVLPLRILDIKRKVHSSPNGISSTLKAALNKPNPAALLRGKELTGFGGGLGGTPLFSSVEGSRLSTPERVFLKELKKPGKLKSSLVKRLSCAPRLVLSMTLPSTGIGESKSKSAPPLTAPIDLIAQKVFLAKVESPVTSSVMFI